MLRRRRLLLMDVSPATPNDIPAVEALLADAGLPLIGAATALRTGVVARDHESAVIGAAAVEPYGHAGLLRSVVVRHDRQRSGFGRALVAAVESLARDLGIGELYLLTETAESWFSGLGYVAVERSALPAAILASDEVAVACAATAVAMRRVI